MAVKMAGKIAVCRDIAVTVIFHGCLGHMTSEQQATFLVFNSFFSRLLHPNLENVIWFDFNWYLYLTFTISLCRPWMTTGKLCGHDIASLSGLMPKYLVSKALPSLKICACCWLLVLHTVKTVGYGKVCILWVSDSLRHVHQAFNLKMHVMWSWREAIWCIYSKQTYLVFAIHHAYFSRQTNRVP